MKQIGVPGFRAALRGLGWKASANFAGQTREDVSAKRTRENRLKAAIRRLAFKENQ